MATRNKQNAMQDFYTDMPVGEILRRARLQLGQSIPEVESILRIRGSYLEALENSDFQNLPGSVYVIGFVRTYADYLGLDGGRTVELLKRQSRALTTPQELNAPIPVQDSRLPSVPLVGAVVAFLALFLALWVAYQGTRLSGSDDIPNVPSDFIPAPMVVAEEEKKQKPVMGPVMPDHPPQPAAPGATPTTPPVEIRLLDDSWIELRGPDDKVVDARLFRKGEAIPLAFPVGENNKSYSMTVGNSGAVEIFVDGKSIGLLGEVGKVRRNISLNPKTLRALVSP